MREGSGPGKRGGVGFIGTEGMVVDWLWKGDGDCGGCEVEEKC